jgi:hypothetical protein
LLFGCGVPVANAFGLKHNHASAAALNPKPALAFICATPLEVSQQSLVFAMVPLCV